MELDTLCARLDELLATEDYADVDASANGLQVGRTGGTVDHVAVAVDAAQATIEAAAEAGADLLVTHHGLVWGGVERVTGQHYRRIAPLVENDLGLYAAHLPLDGHQDIGNAAALAELLDLGNRAPLGTVGGQYVGQRCRTLAPYGLIQNLGNGVYPITEKGEQYLDEELDVRELEKG
jgi:putative NIF3 family GTP cyclohydrolase 1 type 2